MNVLLAGRVFGTEEGRRVLMSDSNGTLQWLGGLHLLFGLITWFAVVWLLLGLARWVWKKGDRVK